MNITITKRILTYHHKYTPFVVMASPHQLSHLLKLSHRTEANTINHTSASHHCTISEKIMAFFFGNKRKKSNPLWNQYRGTQR